MRRLPLASLVAAWAFLSYSQAQGFRPFKPVQKQLKRQPAPGVSDVTFQHIERGDDAYSVEYGFRNFNQEALKIAVEMPESDVEAASSEFGFREKDFAALDEWYRKAQEGAISRSKLLFFNGTITGRDQNEVNQKLMAAKQRNAAIQAGLDTTLSDLAKEYREKRLKLYQSAGFRYKDTRTVEADVPSLVKRNAPRMAPVSRAFADIAQQHEYGMEELVGAVTAMAQTSIRYEIPFTKEGDRTIGGILPPPKAFVVGQGDCDTKTALISSVLLNWPNLRLVGLAIPGHYLLGVHRPAAKGEYFVEYQGLQYVMIESAGPAWLQPGSVGTFTEDYLKSGQMFAIQPFLNN